MSTKSVALVRQIAIRRSQSSLQTLPRLIRSTHILSTQIQHVSPLTTSRLDIRNFASSSILRSGNPRPQDTPTDIPIKKLTDSEYDHLSEIDMETLNETLEDLCENYAPDGWEVEYSSGVLNLQTPLGTYVLNKQPPNHQIWMSSPVSGPARFGYGEDGAWIHHRRAGVVLGKLLEGELREALGDGVRDWEGVGLK